MRNDFDAGSYGGLRQPRFRQRDNTVEYHVRKAAYILSTGGVIAYPTEGVWGLGCLPSFQLALDRVLEIKGRDARKGLILVAADITQLHPYIGSLPTSAEQDMLASWPGPVTWIVPASDQAPEQVTGGRGTVAVRVSNHPLVRRLCQLTDSALVSTSANRSGHIPAANALAVRIRFQRELDYILPGALGAQAGPSEIREALTGAVIRPAMKGERT